MRPRDLRQIQCDEGSKQERSALRILLNVTQCLLKNNDTYCVNPSAFLTFVGSKIIFKANVEVENREQKFCQTVDCDSFQLLGMVPMEYFIWDTDMSRCYDFVCISLVTMFKHPTKKNHSSGGVEGITFKVWYISLETTQPVFKGKLAPPRWKKCNMIVLNESLASL